MNKITDLDRIINSWITWTKAYKFFTQQEAYQIGYEGYLKALSKWDKDKHEDIGITYVQFYIRHALQKEIARLVKFNKNHSLDSEAIEGYANLNIEDEVEVTRTKRLKGQLRSMFRILTPKERAVMEDYFYSEPTLTFMQLAAKYNISKQRIHQIKDKALEKLKNELKKTKEY